MKVILTFHEYQGQSYRDITGYYIERTLGLHIQKVDTDKLLIEYLGLSIEDFERCMSTYRYYGYSGITKIEYKKSLDG